MTMIISGAVSVRLHGLLKHKYLPGNWGILFDGKGSQPPCIKLYTEQGEDSPVHILMLQHLKFSDKSYHQQEAHFNLSVRKEKHQLLFDSIRDKDDWVQALCHVSPELWSQRASSLHGAELKSAEASEEAMRDNFLYDSCDKVQQFKISVCPTKASTANKLEGNYILSPSQDSLLLLEVDSLRNVHEWPYKQIRKYGGTRLNFIMEVGRKCSTGEGEFDFFTPDCARLVESISNNVKKAKYLCKQSEEKHNEVSNASSEPSYEAQPSPQLLPPRSYLVSGKQDAPPLAPRSKANASPIASNPHSENDSDFDEACGEAGHDKQFHSKNKKLSDKEKKRQEKAAAKLRKQQEKERGREAKERKEKEKKLKESKGKSRQTEVQKVESDIYDEPEDIGATVGVLPSGHSAEPGHRPCLELSDDAAVYSMPEKPQRDGWRKHVRPEQDHMHTENYIHMKGACQGQPKPPSPFMPASHPQINAEDDTYNRLGESGKQTAISSDPENVYGMASAKATLPSRPPPIGGRDVKDKYENAPDPLPGKPAPRQIRPCDGDYAEVS